MKCTNCGKEMVEERRDYEYKSLPGVRLCNVPSYRCPSCDEEAVGIPHIAELNHVLAHDLIRQRARLRPAEIVFMRKYLGLSASNLAKLLGVSKSTVSRWENGKQQIGPTTERLIRLLAYTHKPVDDYEIFDALARLDTDPGSPAPHPTLRYSGGWEAVA